MSEGEPAGNVPSTKADLECSKLEAERSKLIAEVAVLRRPFFRTPAFFTAMAPVVLAVLGLVFTWASGWFDVQRMRVTNEKLLLEAETERLKQDRTALNLEALQQRGRLSVLEAEVSLLGRDKASLTNQIAALEHERALLCSANTALEAKASRLAGSETNILNALAELRAERNTLKGQGDALAEKLSKKDALLERARSLASEELGIRALSNPELLPTERKVGIITNTMYLIFDILENLREDRANKVSAPK